MADKSVEEINEFMDEAISELGDRIEEYEEGEIDRVQVVEHLKGGVHELKQARNKRSEALRQEVDQIDG